MTRKHGIFAVFWTLVSVASTSTVGLHLLHTDSENMVDVVVITVGSLFFTAILLLIPALVYADDSMYPSDLHGGRYFYPVTKKMRVRNRIRTKHLEAEEHLRRSGRCREIAEELEGQGRVEEAMILYRLETFKAEEAVQASSEMKSLQESLLQSEITKLAKG